MIELEAGRACVLRLARRFSVVSASSPHDIIDPAAGPTTAGPTSADRRFQQSPVRSCSGSRKPREARCFGAQLLQYLRIERLFGAEAAGSAPAARPKKHVVSERSGSPPPLEDGARRGGLAAAAELRRRAGRAATTASRGRLAQRRPLRRDVRLPRRREMHGRPRGLPLQADGADEGRGGVPRLLRRWRLRRLRVPELRQGLRERHQAVLVAHGQLLQHELRVGQRDVLPAADQEAVQPVGGQLRL